MYVHFVERMHYVTPVKSFKHYLVVSLAEIFFKSTAYLIINPNPNAILDNKYAVYRTPYFTLDLIKIVTNQWSQPSDQDHTFHLMTSISHSKNLEDR